jgi:hypothetical protein
VDEVEVRVGRLSAAERLTLASLSGVSARYGWGTQRDAPRDEAVAAVREVTTDSRLLGIVAGQAAVDPYGTRRAEVELLLAAGADPDVAAAAEAELRTRLDRRQTRHRGE